MTWVAGATGRPPVKFLHGIEPAGGLVRYRCQMKPLKISYNREQSLAVMESRIVPLLPWGIVNFSAGLSRLRYRDLALGTVVGAAPKVFAYVALGGSLSDLTSPDAIVAIVLLAVLALAGAFFVKRQVALGRA